MDRHIAAGRYPLTRQLGATYLGLLLFIAISGLALAATLEIWHTTLQRDKEAELLVIGNEFRNALNAYYEAKPANVIGQPVRSGQRPKRLEDLLTDNRFTVPQRWLRKLYVDPMTGRPEWGVVTLPDGQITGVHSLSDETPLKQAGFKNNDADFNDKTRYAEWVFAPKIKGPTTAGGIVVQNSLGGEMGSSGGGGSAPMGTGSGGVDNNESTLGGGTGQSRPRYTRQWREQSGVVMGEVTPRHLPNAKLREQQNTKESP